MNDEKLSPFDAMAADYDVAFARSAIGTRMRRAVWRQLDAHFRPGDRLLEVGCGTGEDALYLAQRGIQVLATDVSQRMIAVAQAKTLAAGLDHAIATACFNIEDLARFGKDKETRRQGDKETRDRYVQHAPHLPISLQSPYDGLLSNFGALNCVADLPGVLAGMASLLRPGGVALLCVMGPLVPWEWAWYLGRGQPAKALRRLRPGGVQWRGLTIRYPSIGTLLRACAPHFRPLRGTAIGALLPPSYVEPWAKEHPLLLHALDRIERRFERAWPLPWLADHYLIELECM